jgi:predicted lipoprotein with Yx(FWY)xxD motif
VQFLALALALVAAAPAQNVAVVETAHNDQLDRTILVNRRGLSLYSLSAETKGRFICTDSACLSLWKPLTIARGKRPTGARSLATVKRPNGKIQVTYRGRPLYRFVEDTRRGDVRGEGFRDVGVWRAARVPG